MVLLTQLVVIISTVTTAIQGARIRRYPLDLTPTGDWRTCVAKNNMPGVCVHESVCNEDHKIEHGGDIEKDELREKKQCSAQGEWCCTSELIPPPQIGRILSDQCLPPETDVCPWCVLLYNAVDKKTAHLPFCLGALIGSKVIITASTCIVAAQKKIVYAQVPNSANPAQNYTVIRQQFHPGYNSGSHEYDFGIMVIDNDVMFEGKARGACIDFEILSEPEDRCVGYGFDAQGKITSTVMKVKKNSCGKSGSSKDAACGLSLDDVCIVAGGGPVLCQKKNKDLDRVGLDLLGIARSTCNEDNQVTLGSIALSKQWIEAELASMKIDKDVYTRVGQ